MPLDLQPCLKNNSSTFFIIIVYDLHRAIKLCKVHHLPDDISLLFRTIGKFNKLINIDLKNCLISLMLTNFP